MEPRETSGACARLDTPPMVTIPEALSLYREGMLARLELRAFDAIRSRDRTATEDCDYDAAYQTLDRVKERLTEMVRQRLGISYSMLEEVMG